MVLTIKQIEANLHRGQWVWEQTNSLVAEEESEIDLSLSLLRNFVTNSPTAEKALLKGYSLEGLSMKRTRQFHTISSRCASPQSPPILPPPVCHHCIMGTNGMKLTRRVLGRALVRLLERSHCSFICLLCTVCFSRGLRCAHSLTLAHLFWAQWEAVFV